MLTEMTLLTYTSISYVSSMSVMICIMRGAEVSKIGYHEPQSQQQINIHLENNQACVFTSIHSMLKLMSTLAKRKCKLPYNQI